jgi:HK97 family phage prohead protease
MDEPSMEQQRREAAEKRRESFSAAKFPIDQARRTPPRLAEPRTPGMPINGQRRGAGGDESPFVHDRVLSFPAEFRGENVERDGKNFYRVEGVASSFNRAYEMWDVFGPYDEEVVEGAADDTLARKPDVVFLINHRGLSLARTAGPWNGNTGTLELSADATGLRDVAWLNPERSEVKDLALAIDDKIVTEQSFAFMIDEGVWNEDFTKFQIVRFDINRGDVSAVNYGANPYTSIAARQQEILTDLRLAGPSMARAALHSLLQRGDVDIDSEVDRINDERRDAFQSAALAGAINEFTGRSIAQIEAMLLD